MAEQAHKWVESSDAFRTSSGHQISYRREGSGPTIVLFHGFPTWSYDYAQLVADLSHDFDVITFDFLGYGFSDKPRRYDFSVRESADTVEALLAHLNVDDATLVIHDYGAIVGQELLDRHRRGHGTFAIDRLFVLNCGVDFSAYRPTPLQEKLLKPISGALLARRLSAANLRAVIDGVRGSVKTSDEEFDNLWFGISNDRGHTLAHRHIRYNNERVVHHERWESALAEYQGPLHLIWGMDDPVSGEHVLDLARNWLPRAHITELKGVGHFPQSEAPASVAAAIRDGSR